MGFRAAGGEFGGDDCCCIPLLFVDLVLFVSFLLCCGDDVLPLGVDVGHAAVDGVAGFVLEAEHTVLGILVHLFGEDSFEFLDEVDGIVECISAHIVFGEGEVGTFFEHPIPRLISDP